MDEELCQRARDDTFSQQRTVMLKEMIKGLKSDSEDQPFKKEGTLHHNNYGHSMCIDMIRTCIRIKSEYS